MLRKCEENSISLEIIDFHTRSYPENTGNSMQEIDSIIMIKRSVVILKHRAYITGSTIDDSRLEKTVLSRALMFNCLYLVSFSTWKSGSVSPTMSSTCKRWELSIVIVQNCQQYKIWHPQVQNICSLTGLWGDISFWPFPPLVWSQHDGQG